MLRLSNNGAAGRRHGLGRIGGEGLAEHVVGRDEEPFLATGVDESLGDGVGERIGRWRPLRPIGGTLIGDEVRGVPAGYKRRDAALLRDRLRREPCRTRSTEHERTHSFLIDITAGERRGYVGFVL